MLPPGHVAAGYIIANAFLHFVPLSLSSLDKDKLIWFGLFFAFAPDLDMFYSFFKIKSFVIHGTEINHRAYYWHAPLLWFFAALVLFVLSNSVFVRSVAVLLWLCSWSHFFLDSFRTGVMWLFPFSKRFFAFSEPGVMEDLQTKGFWKYWIDAVKIYQRVSPFVFYFEIVLLFLATFVYIK